MSGRITIYQKPSCTTCRQSMKILKEEGINFDAVDYYLTPIPAKKLRELLSKMGSTPREILRTREPVYAQLKIGQRSLSDEELIELMVQYPDLIQRPIVEKGERAILARPAERIRLLFKK